ncbi:hypothetical protein JTB14_014078 [Gonioctena quinquepunctata]|nr:hypothetical protein JTB14_014078 [Gonioctena quinquepunctata]
MVPKYYLIYLSFALIGICSGFNRGFYECPDDSKATTLVSNKEEEVPRDFLGHVTLDVTIPESGLLSAAITCIVVTDLSTDGSGGTVSIVGGGVGSKYVQFKVVSQWMKGLKYRFQIYTA